MRPARKFHLKFHFVHRIEQTNSAFATRTTHPRKDERTLHALSEQRPAFHFPRESWNVKIIVIYRQIIPRNYYYVTTIFHHWRLLRWIMEGTRNNWYLLGWTSYEVNVVILAKWIELLADEALDLSRWKRWICDKCWIIRDDPLWQRVENFLNRQIRNSWNCTIKNPEITRFRTSTKRRKFRKLRDRKSQNEKIQNCSPSEWENLYLF